MDAIRIFVPVALPSSCYLQEAATWIAFGRPPPEVGAWPEPDNEYEEARRSRREYEERGGIVAVDGGYSEREFVANGINIDYGRYDAARDLAYWGQSGAEALAEFENGVGKWLRKSDPEMYARERERLVAASIELDWVLEIEGKLAQVVDLARAEVFRALAVGRLVAEGWPRDFLLENVPDREVVQRESDFLVKIPSNLWTLQGIDWHESVLNEGEGYYGVQIPLSEMLSVFPRPSSEASPVRAMMYAGSLLVDDERGVPQTSNIRRRGRPPLESAVEVRTIVQNYFRDRYTRRQFPAKGEARVQEVIDFVRVTFARDIGRSTAQEYLVPLRSLLPENSEK